VDWLYEENLDPNNERTDEIERWTSEVKKTLGKGASLK
jgi:hypothetical protein